MLEKNPRRWYNTKIVRVITYNSKKERTKGESNYGF